MRLIIIDRLTGLVIRQRSDSADSLWSTIAIVVKGLQATHINQLRSTGQAEIGAYRVRLR